jgi:CRP-like cAMP-binding protein
MELVRDFPLFSQISPEDCSKIVAAAHERTYLRDRTIYFEGDPVKQVILLTSGCVKLSQTGPQGQEVILRLVGPGESLCAECFPNHSHRSTAQTMELSAALVWEASQFEALANRFSALGRNISCALLYTLNQLEVRFREICTQKAAPRLVNQLVRLVNQVGKRTNGHVEIGLTQRDLAQLTGMTLFTVSRLLGQWQELGIVKNKRQVLTILNVPALEEISRAEEMD